MVDEVEKKVLETIKKYKLFSKGEKIVVALSGGKDSTSVLYLLNKHKKRFEIDVEAMMIELGFGQSLKGKENLIKFCKELGIKFTLLKLNENQKSSLSSAEKKGLNTCYVCGVLKKRLINKFALKNNFDKVVTGHNLDDGAETILMNFLKGNVFLGAGAEPITKKQKQLVQRAKPLFFISNKQVENYAKKMKFPVVFTRCPYLKSTYRLGVRQGFEILGLDDKKKLKIVENWLKMIPNLRKKDSREFKRCSMCGVACSGTICSACSIGLN